MILKINPYKLGSKSAKALANSLNTVRIYNTFRRRPHHVILNWGVGHNTINRFCQGLDLNNLTATRVASNKIQFLESIKQINSLQHTVNVDLAKLWIEEGHKVYCRTNIFGNSGDGIVIAEQIDELVYAPLYTRQVKHDREFRVHIFKGEVLDVTEKKRRNGSGATSYIRNHVSGYVFCRNNLVEIPQILLDKCVEACNIVGLDFGAFDVGYSFESNEVYIFECNTAPGLEGTTLLKYSQAIYNHVRSL